MLVLITILSSIFTHAREDGIVSANPSEKPGKYLNTPPKERAQFLTPQESNALMDAARKHSPRLYPLILAALRTGARQSELLGMKWADLDTHGGFIEIKRTIYNGQEGSPKNGRTRRVDMSDGLREALAHHKRVLPAEALASGRPMAESIFPGEEGKPIWATKLRQRFACCLTKAGLRHVPFHSLRHSYASHLIALGNRFRIFRGSLDTQA